VTSPVPDDRAVSTSPADPVAARTPGPVVALRALLRVALALWASVAVAGLAVWVGHLVRLVQGTGQDGGLGEGLASLSFVLVVLAVLMGALCVGALRGLRARREYAFGLSLVVHGAPAALVGLAFGTRSGYVLPVLAGCAAVGVVVTLVALRSQARS
jgi:hypothetical protein